jgi:amino acid permease
VDYDEVFSVKGDHHLITSMNIVIFAYAVQFMTFPTYSELENRSFERYSKASCISTLLYTSVFIFTGVVAMLLFGSDIEADFLVNLADREGNVSVFCRVSYCVVLAFHIPYFFFSSKEMCLVIYDEIQNRSMSTRMEAKLAEFQQREREKEASTHLPDSNHPQIRDPDQDSEVFEQPAEETTHLVSTPHNHMTDDLSESGHSSATFNSVRSGLTYKKLSDNVFLLTAVILHATIVILALTLTSVESLFDFVGAIGASATMFGFPAIAYIVALKRHGTSRIRQKWETTFYHVSAWVFCLLQLVVLAMFFWLKIGQARGTFSEDSDEKTSS